MHVCVRLFDLVALSIFLSTISARNEKTKAKKKNKTQTEINIQGKAI